MIPAIMVDLLGAQTGVDKAYIGSHCFVYGRISLGVSRGLILPTSSPHYISLFSIEQSGGQWLDDLVV